MLLPRRVLTAVASLSIALASSAATVNVSSISELESAIAAVAPGDTIVVANGSYVTSGSISIGRVATSDAPITIKAETVGGVTISGAGGFRFVSPAAYITIDGFVFNHSGSINIPAGTSHCRLTRNVVELSIPAGSDVSYINISGDDVEIDHNELRNKSTLGEMLDIAGSGSQVARRLWVHHNYFHDFVSPGGNGAETIRWGLSGLSLSTGDGLCEYNLFVRCNGENEMISNKSSGNTYRYNTVIDSQEISQRHGDNNQYYGNYMRGSAGIRIYGDSNLVYSNYLEGNDFGVNIGNGDGDVHNGDPLTSHDRPDNCVIVYNTMINNTTQYFMNGRTGGLGATNTTFANNILQGGTTAVSISSTAPYASPTWLGNIIWNAGNIGNIPAGGYTVVDPLLATDASGVFHLQPGSPAIDAGQGDYAFVSVDQDGQVRDAAKDKGADEVSTGTITAKLLTPADVGTGAGGGGGTTQPIINFEAENLVFSSVGASASISFEDSPSGGQYASPHVIDPTDPLYPERHRYVTLNADGNPPPPDGEYIEFTLPNVPHGTYDLVLRYKTHPTNRGIMRLSVDGNVLGSDLDQLVKATFTTHDFGVVRFATDGDHVVRLAVVGKSNLAKAPTSPWNITADVITLIPDVTKPEFTSFPSDLQLEATSPAGAVATYSATATDNKDGAVPVVFSPPSGSTFPLGENLVVATAEDFAGNIAVASFGVNVVDTTPPTITAASASPATLWPPNHQMVPVTISVAASDIADPAPRAKIISVSSNQPANGTGDGNTPGDFEITGDLTVNLRAERSGSGGDRVYTIVVESRDASGNASTGSVTVIVPHDHGKN